MPLCFMYTRNPQMRVQWRDVCVLWYWPYIGAMQGQWWDPAAEAISPTLAQIPFSPAIEKGGADENISASFTYPS